MAHVEQIESAIGQRDRIAGATPIGYAAVEFFAT